LKILDREISKMGRPYLIAEAGATHEGDPEMAIKMTLAGIEARADAITFQEIDEEKLYSEIDELPVPEQKRIGWGVLEECRKICHEKGVAFSVCVTDSESLDRAVDLGIDFIKIVSYDISFEPFLRQCAQKKKPILLSTGASTFEEVGRALEIIGPEAEVCIYHTDCGYPTEDSEVNLLRMLSLGEFFQIPVGYCDHTSGTLSCLAAASLGADLIEKHFTIDKSLGGSDHMVALEPGELIAMFAEIRRIADIRGDGADKIEESSVYRRENLRRSIALAKNISKGEVLEERHLTMLRPPIGLEWADRGEIIGKRAKTDLKKRKIIRLGDLE
tara:strand:- start:1065 stop:2054 length:990 start_codon:yes stop_codon:yes gene_type:complete